MDLIYMLNAFSFLISLHFYFCLVDSEMLVLRVSLTKAKVLNDQTRVWHVTRPFLTRDSPPSPLNRKGRGKVPQFSCSLYTRLFSLRHSIPESSRSYPRALPSPVHPLSPPLSSKDSRPPRASVPPQWERESAAARRRTLLQSRRQQKSPDCFSRFVAHGNLPVSCNTSPCSARL